MGDEVTARDFGHIEAEVAGLKALVLEMKGDIKTMSKSWDEAQGGIKVLLAFSAVLGAGLTYGFNWIMSHIKLT